MRGKTDFSAARLRGQLRPWTFAGTAHTPDELEAYRRFYGFTADVDHRIGTLEIAGQSIVVQVFLPERPVDTTMFVHGYYDHVGLFVFLIEHLLSRNIAVVSCDLPGHGLSSGDRVTIDSFDTYVQVVRTVVTEIIDSTSGRLPKPFHLVGQSMGGAIAMEYVERYGLEGIRSVTLVAPLVVPHLWAINRWVFVLVRPFVKTRPRGSSSTDQPEFQALRAVDPLQAQVLPLQWVTAMVAWQKRFEKYPAKPDFKPFVLQGTGDRVVAWRYNLRVLQRRYHPVVLELPQATHHLANEAPEVRSRMWQWLDEQIQWGKSHDGA